MNFDIILVCYCLLAQSCPTHCDPVDCIARQAPLSMEFPGQEYWSGLPTQGSNPSLLHCRQILCCLGQKVWRKKDEVGFRWGLSLPQSVLMGRSPPQGSALWGEQSRCTLTHPTPPAPPRLTLDVWGLPASRAHHTSVLDVINLECLF